MLHVLIILLIVVLIWIKFWLTGWGSTIYYSVESSGYFYSCTFCFNSTINNTLSLSAAKWHVLWLTSMLSCPFLLSSLLFFLLRVVSPKIPSSEFLDMRLVYPKIVMGNSGYKNLNSVIVVHLVTFRIFSLKTRMLTSTLSCLLIVTL
jgi:hypothetical protein